METVGKLSFHFIQTPNLISPIDDINIHIKMISIGLLDKQTIDSFFLVRSTMAGMKGFQFSFIKWDSCIVIIVGSHYHRHIVNETDAVRHSSAHEITKNLIFD